MSVKITRSNGALEAELLRNVLDTVTHDLGGLSSALALRADVMQRSAPSAAADACSAIAGELRSLGAQLREMSGPRGPGTLSPTPTGSLRRWFALITRFGQPLLGRGVALRGEVDDVNIGSAAAHALTYIVLALLHALRDGHTPMHTLIRIASERRDHAIAIRISLYDGEQPRPVAEDAGNAWWTWALERAAGSQMDMRVTDGHVELLVAIAHTA